MNRAIPIRNKTDSSTASVPDLKGHLRDKLAEEDSNTIKDIEQGFNLQVHRDAIDGQMVSEEDQVRKERQRCKELDAAIAEWRTRNGISERDAYIRLKEARIDRLKILDRMNDARRKKIVSINGVKNLAEADHKYIDSKGAVSHFLFFSF